jgi:uncharacterized protein
MSASQFTWYELITSDTKAAVAFYTAVIGWTTNEIAGPEPYTVLSAAGAGVGGIARLTGTSPKVGDAPAWIGYIQVDDVDAYAARVREAGGAIIEPPQDIPDMLRFSTVADPQGARFVVHRGMLENPPPRSAPGTPGTAGWRELFTTDWHAAWGFYAGLFGWEKGPAMEMGPVGTYQLFTADGEQIGGMMNVPDAPPSWLYTFTVGDIDAAKARVNEAGGTVTNGPQEVPGGLWVLQATDPQGARFALVGQKA